MRVVQRIFLLACVTLLIACAPMATNQLLIKPAQPLSNLRVVYLTGAVVADRDGVEAIVFSALEQIGYFDMGKRVLATAPGLLNQRGMQAEAAIISVSKELSPLAIIGGPLNQYNHVLVLTFGRSTISRRNSRGAELNLEAELSEVASRKVIWRGHYPISIENAVEENSKLTKARVESILKQIFADMESNSLLPPVNA